MLTGSLQQLNRLNTESILKNPLYWGFTKSGPAPQRPTGYGLWATALGTWLTPQAARPRPWGYSVNLHCNIPQERKVYGPVRRIAFKWCKISARFPHSPIHYFTCILRLKLYSYSVSSLLRHESTTGTAERIFEWEANGNES